MMRLLDYQDYLESPRCRRTQIAEYFGDEAVKCSGVNELCDNCINGDKATYLDVTSVALMLQSFLKEHQSYDFSSLRDIIKGGQSVDNAVWGILQHWPPDEVERHLRQLRRSGLLAFEPERVGISSKITWKVTLDPKAESCIASSYLFSVDKDFHVAIKALSSNDSNNNLCSSTPLDTQTRNILDNALNRFPAPPTVVQNKSCFDLAGQF